jgi:hypothetical protein
VARSDFILNCYNSFNFPLYCIIIMALLQHDYLINKPIVKYENKQKSTSYSQYSTICTPTLALEKR